MDGKIKNHADFIRVMSEKYPNVDFTKTVYTASRNVVTATCRVHGEFSKQANSMKYGGCPKCSPKGGPPRLTQGEFIRRSNLTHGIGTYDYSLSIYNGDDCKLNIICKEHGVFNQIASNHMRKTGCPSCAKIKQKEKVTMSLGKVMQRFYRKHGGYYDYSLVNYISIKHKIKIICPIHGLFEQTAWQHFQGGCKKCNSVGFTRSGYRKVCERRNNGIADIYLIKCFSEVESFYKIGITCTGLNIRYGNNKNMPYSFEHISSISGKSDDIFDKEKEVHRKLKPYHYSPKIFFQGGVNECFSKLTPEVLDFFGVKDEAA